MITVTYGLITYFDKVTAKRVDNLITPANKISFAVKKDVISGRTNFRIIKNNMLKLKQ